MYSGDNRDYRQVDDDDELVQLNVRVCCDHAFLYIMYYISHITYFAHKYKNTYPHLLRYFLARARTLRSNAELVILSSGE